MRCIASDCLDTHCSSSCVASMPKFVCYSNPAVISQLQAHCPPDQNRGGEWTFRSASKPRPGTGKRPYTRLAVCVCVCVKGAASVRSDVRPSRSQFRHFYKVLRFPSWADIAMALFRGCRSICPCAVGRWSEDFSAKWVTELPGPNGK